jgi:hypothetical protein
MQDPHILDFRLRIWDFKKKAGLRYQILVSGYLILDVQSKVSWQKAAYSKK